MNALTEQLRRYQWPVWFVVAAFALHLFHLGEKSVWLDEALTAYHSTFSAKALWSTPVANKPPLYYVITAWFWSPGASAFWLRMPAAIIGALTVGVAWLIGNALARSRGGHLLALLVLVCDVNLRYSQEARHYILLTLGWALLLLSLIRLLKEAPIRKVPRGIDLLGLGLGATLMLHAHPIAIQYLAAAGLSFGLAGWLTGQRRARFYLYPLLVLLAASITILPWLPVALANAGAQFQWLQQPSPMVALREFVSVFGTRSLAMLGGAQFAMVSSVVMMLLATAGLIIFGIRKHGPLAVFLLGCLILPALLAWLTGFYQPVYMLRTLTPTHLLAMTGLALLIMVLPSRWPQWAATALLVGILAVSSLYYLRSYQKEDWRGLTEYVAEHSQPADMLLLCERDLYWPLWFYLQRNLPPVVDINPRRQRVMIKLAADAPRQSFHTAPLLGPPPSIWVIDRYGHCPGQLQQILMAFTGLVYYPGPSWRGYALTMTPYSIIPAIK